MLLQQTLLGVVSFRTFQFLAKVLCLQWPILPQFQEALWHISLWNSCWLSISGFLVFGMILFLKFRKSDLMNWGFRDEIVLLRFVMRFSFLLDCFFFAVGKFTMEASQEADGESALKLTEFSDQSHDSTFHFQILRLTDQVASHFSAWDFLACTHD